MKLLTSSMLPLVLVLLATHQQAHATCFPAIFYFGDDVGDTGQMHASFPFSTAAEYPPYGETYFGAPQGRNSDGRLIIDFIMEAYGMRYLDPYLQSVTSDFSQGVNFATWGAVARTVNYLSPFPLHTQVLQFQLFQKEVLEVLNGTTAVLGSKGLLGNIRGMALDNINGLHPYKKLYNDLFDTTTGNVSTNQTIDPNIRRWVEAASRVPLPAYFEQGLYMISIGTNDFKVGFSSNQTPQEITGYLPNVVTTITTAIQDLYNSGGRTFVVEGVGTLGCSPSLLAIINFTTSDLDTWGCLEDYNTIARNYNSLLQEALANLSSSLPLMDLTYLDIYQIQHNLLFNYTFIGMLEPIKACCGMSSTYNFSPEVTCGERAVIGDVVLQPILCPDPSVYVVWDGMHYTEAANRYFANQIFSGQFFNPPFSLLRNNCTINVI